MKVSTHNISQDEVLALIGRIYEAAGSPVLWNAFLEQFSNAIQGTVATMIVSDEEHANRNVAAAVRVDMETQRKYEEYYSGLDCWFNNGKHLLRTGKVLTGQMMCP